jgi:hypothetical protein
MNDLIQNIKDSFNNRIIIKEKRPGIYQLFLPIYHEDGDMIDVFIEKKDDRTVRISDYGMSIMRLSYTYEIDSDTKESILQRIISENKMIEKDGNIYYDSDVHNLYGDLLNACQTYMKVSSMRYFKREVVESLFYEMLDDFILSDLNDYEPKKNPFPIPDREDLEADYQLKLNDHSIFLFGVKGAAKARLASISCLEYQKNNLKFRSLIVHDDFEKLSKKDRSILTNACDKQFTTLKDFMRNARIYLEREKLK